MMRVLLIFLLLFASVWLGLQLEQDPGYLLIAMNKWTIETTLWIAIIGLILTVVLIHFLFSFLHRIWKIPEEWNRWRTQRRSQKAQKTTHKGLIELSEGYWAQAKNHLAQGIPDSENPLLNYLTAARAAQEMGENNLRDEFLREAQQTIPDAKIALELTQAKMQIAHGQWEQALATLKHLQSLVPRHPYVLKLLMKVYEQTRDWPQLILLLPELNKTKILSKERFHELQNHVYLQSLEELIQQNHTQSLEHWFTTLPKALKNEPNLMAVYCRFLLDKKEFRQAESLLRSFLKKQWNEKMIELYGMIKSDDARLNFAESFLKTNPHSAALNLCLGRLCISGNLWGKAKTYFEDSIEFGATPEAFLELGSLLEKLNDHPAACGAYRKGLWMITNS
jgi:HemY protein